MKSNKRKKRKVIKQEEKARIEQMFKEQSKALHSCIFTNTKEMVIGINFDKLLSNYIQYFPTVYQDDNGFYFQYSEKLGIWNKITPLVITRHLKRIVKNLVPYFWKASFNKEIEAILPLVCKNADDLKDATNYINLKNGLFSLVTFELEPHRQEIFSTTQLDFSYDPKAKCPKFDKFLNDIFLGNRKLKFILSEAFGYGLSPHTEAQKFFFFYSEGSSGKSVAGNILFHLAGGKEQVASVALSDSGERFQRSQTYGKLVNISFENEQVNHKPFNTQALKAITSGDLIQLEFKNKDPFTDVIKAKLFFVVNNLPVADDKTFAYMRRVVLIPFLARFVDKPDKNKKNEKERNPYMEKELLQELPGIFNWAMKGLKRLIKNKYQFTISKVAQKVVKRYFNEINPISVFINETIYINKDSKVALKSIYEAYKMWAKENGERVESKIRFFKNFRQILSDVKIPFGEHKSNDRFLTGIALKNPANLDINEI